MRERGDFIPLTKSLPGKRVYVKKKKRTAVNKRVLYLSIQALLNALVIGVVAKLLIFLIDLITNLAFYHRFSFLPGSPANHHLGVMVILVPVAGGLIVGLMAKYGSKAITGHGIPEAMERIILADSKIPPALTFLKPISAAVSIGTGGPFGAEGPIIATGAAFGSLTGQLMHINPAERKIILAAGACAGMAAIFGSPLAALLLAVELLLFEFSPRSIIPVAVGCITGAGMHILLFGKELVFVMQAIPQVSIGGLAIYMLFGLLIGVAASYISKSVYVIEDYFERSSIPWMWWPALGALAIGVTGFFAPYTMGVGYENIQQLLTGTVPLTLLLSLCFLKYISWSISLGSGTSGGTLAPLLTIGGAFGGLLGYFLLHYFPTAPIQLTTAVLIGMAAMFAGASRALLTSIVFVLETTGQINGLLPVLAASLSSYFISFFLMKGSIMTEKIQRRGVITPDAFEPDIFKGVTCGKLMSKPQAATEETPFVFQNDDVGFAVELMGKYKVDRVQVVDNKHSMTPVGSLSSTAVIGFYSQQKHQQHTYASPGRTRRIIVQGRKLLMKNYSSNS
jgi:chloride channel protein, CIC family